MPDKQHMSVTYTEFDSGIPGLVFCSDFEVPITSKTFVQTFITNYEDRELWFKIPFTAGNKLSFAWENESEGTLRIFWSSKFMGYAYVEDVYNALSKCLLQLQHLKSDN